MLPPKTSENHTISQLPQYLCTSSEAPNLCITKSMNYYYYNDPLVNDSGSVVFPSTIVQPEVGKKDRHSKIVTARGPRDRRVRLSIDIAKKFFGLQDMLGFDKASETLGWLLTKSKPAIEELAQKKILADILRVTKSANSDRSDLLQAEKLARESRRTKARARARERTIKKLCGASIPTQSLSLITNKCTSCTKIKADVELDRKFCNNEQLISHGHGDMLPCSSTGNAWDLSTIVASTSTQKRLVY